jgi:genome maintenance exonuclease 1
MYIHCPPKELPKLQSVTQPDGKRYYTSPNGVILPSVTTVIGAKKKQSIMEWRQRVGEEEANRVSRFASGRGTKIHNLVERYLLNETVDWNVEMPDGVYMFRKIARELKNINNIHYMEEALWSEKIGLAGRVDCIAEWKGKLSIIDFKTSQKIKTKEQITDYFAQCTAYALMYEELVGDPIDQIVILMAVDEGVSLVFEEKTQDHIENLADFIDFYHKSNK